VTAIGDEVANPLISMNRKIVHHKKITYTNKANEHKKCYLCKMTSIFCLSDLILGIKHLRRNLSKTSVFVFSFVTRALTTPQWQVIWPRSKYTCSFSKRSYTWMGRFLYRTGHILPFMDI
jgi:hypothetical protein